MAKRVVIESPFAGDIDANVEYARKCMHESIVRFGEAPIASHLLYTQPHILDDDVPEQRELGIQCGFDWWDVAETVVFYIDRGISRGMKFALKRAIETDKPFEVRMLGYEEPTMIDGNGTI